MSLNKWLVAGVWLVMAAGCGSPTMPGGLKLQNAFINPGLGVSPYAYGGYYGGSPYGYPGHYPRRRFIRDRDGFARPCEFINPSYDPARIAEENEVAFRLIGEATWRPKCVSRPWIAEENEEAYRPIGADIWRPRWGY